MRLPGIAVRLRALALFSAGKPSRFRFRVNGEDYLLDTLRVKDNGANSISWTCQYMSKTHEQMFASFTFSGDDLSGSVVCNKCVHVIEPVGPRKIKITKCANDPRPPTPPIEVSRTEADLDALGQEIDAVVGGGDAEVAVSGAVRALGASGTTSLVNGFKRLRILLVFNVPVCTTNERNSAANVDNMLTLVFSNNMACQTGRWFLRAASFPTAFRIATHLRPAWMRSAARCARSTAET
jgi:hypothetical protein